MSSRTRIWLIAVPAAYFLFFFALTDVGLLGPDEPRYASIGREMARSGDWVTPRLWGKPWFEKPPLLYWMIAVANRAGLGEDLAPRLPVAVTSVAFLFIYFWLLRAELGRDAALFSTVILGTSALWLAFSHLGATDLPMSATFAGAMLMGLRWASSGQQRWLTGAAALLALAVLAKGLVPLVLAVPLLWLGRGRLRELVRPLPVAVFFVVAAPWYILVTARNGSAFLTEFFWKHHFARFTTDALLHQQPFWFYVPVFLAALYPWTPLAALLFRKGFYGDRRRKFLVLWIVFGFLFFSASANKLPGYVLPLLPAAAALLGLALAEARDARWTLGAACLLLTLIPVVSVSLPNILVAGGLLRAEITGWNWAFALTYAALAGLVWSLEEIGRRQAAAGVLVVAVVVGVVYLKVLAFPRLDRLASARSLWNRISVAAAKTCVEGIHRNWRYGLNYYSVTPLPDCSEAPRPRRIRQTPGHPPWVN